MSKGALLMISLISIDTVYSSSKWTEKKQVIAKKEGLFLPPCAPSKSVPGITNVISLFTGVLLTKSWLSLDICDAISKAFLLFKICLWFFAISLQKLEIQASR